MARLSTGRSPESTQQGGSSGLTAIFGFLGQGVGCNKATHLLQHYGAVNPQNVIPGIGESLATTVFGMFTLVVAAFLWFGLDPHGPLARTVPRLPAVETPSRRSTGGWAANPRGWRQRRAPVEA